MNSQKKIVFFSAIMSWIIFPFFITYKSSCCCSVMPVSNISIRNFFCK